MEKSKKSLRVIKQFYAEAQRRTGFTQEKCREILITHYGPNFETSKTEEYYQTLKEYALDVATKKALDELHRKQNAAMQILLDRMPKEPPCRVPGCCGVIIGRYGQQRCSQGGLRHYLVARISESSGIPIDILLEQVNQLAQEKEAIAIAEYQEWKDKVHEPIQPQEGCIFPEQ